MGAELIDGRHRRRTARGVKYRAPHTRLKKILLGSACGIVRQRAQNRCLYKEIALAGPLPLPRQEAFAQGVAAGLSGTKSYARAYGRTANNATRACAARLLTNAHVADRIDELRREGAEQTKASLQLLVLALEERARSAIGAGELGTATVMVCGARRCDHQRHPSLRTVWLRPAERLPIAGILAVL